MKAIRKILLINPPFEDFYQTPIRQIPLGLKYIQASLEKAGYQTVLLDCLSENRKRTIPIPETLKYLQKYYLPNDLSPFKLFTHYRRFGIKLEEIAEQVKEIQPELIGISINFTPYWETAIEVAQICKLLLPQVPIVAGGHHATAAPERLLDSKAIDFVILGEGEERMVEFVKLLSTQNLGQLNDLDGIAFVSCGQIKINQQKYAIENLDNLSQPNQDNDLAMILTSRGCPKNCNFCSVAKVVGKKIRYRTIASVIAEMEIYLNKGILKFDFEDDNLTFNRQRAHRLFSAIKSQFAGKNLILSAMNGLMADSFDEELIRTMKEAGFEWLNIPLVSGSEQVQKKIKRYQSREQFLKVINWAKKYELKVIAYLILGLPEDDLKQMLDDILFLAALPVIIGPSLFYPPPRSATFQNCVRENFISGYDFALYRSTAIPVETNNFSRGEIITLFRLVRLINYMKQKPELLKTNFLSKHPKKSAKANSLTFEHKLNQEEIGKLIIDQLAQNKNFRGLALKAKNGTTFQYQWLNYFCSQKIVAEFLSKLKGLPMKIE